MKRYKSIRPPEVIVAAIASHFVLSRTIPAMPNMNAAGIEIIISSPPRAAIMLPQPGLQISSIRNVTADTASNFADIFPKYTLSSLAKDKMRVPVLAIISQFRPAVQPPVFKCLVYPARRVTPIRSK